MVGGRLHSDYGYSGDHLLTLTTHAGGGSMISYAAAPTVTPLAADLGTPYTFLDHDFNGSLAPGKTDFFTLALAQSELFSTPTQTAYLGRSACERPRAARCGPLCRPLPV